VSPLESAVVYGLDEPPVVDVAVANAAVGTAKTAAKTAAFKSVLFMTRFPLMRGGEAGGIAAPGTAYQKVFGTGTAKLEMFTGACVTMTSGGTTGPGVEN
jgi:hypothetical protein